MVGVFGVDVVKLVVVEYATEHAQILLQQLEVMSVMLDLSCPLDLDLVKHVNHKHAQSQMPNKDALVINLYFYFH